MARDAVAGRDDRDAVARSAGGRVGHVGAVGARCSQDLAPRRSGGAVLTMDGQAERMGWIGHVVVGVRAVLSFAGRRTAVPLAWRNMLADKRRLLRSTSGIAFAVLLMLLQLGFRGAFFDSAVAVIRNIDSDILLTSSSKFSFAGKNPFSRRQLYAARAVEGVESARPIYAEWPLSWKNPQTGKIYAAQVLAFDPDQPV